MAEDLRIYPHRSSCKVLGEYYQVRYLSPISGKLVRIPLDKSGKFKTKEEAISWGRKNVKSMLDDERKRLNGRAWSRDIAVVKLLDEFVRYRQAENPRSRGQDKTWILNYVFPFFLGKKKIFDPNKWHKCQYEYHEWLRFEAKTKEGKPPTAASGNKAICTLNKFLIWLEEKNTIKEYRRIKLFKQKHLNKRDSSHLVSDDVYNKVLKYLRKDKKTLVYADMWMTQRRMGFRANELMGLAFHWFSDECHDFIKEEFENKGLKVLGSLHLESQPSKAWIPNDRSKMQRVPLKGRPKIGDDFSRQVPIIGDDLWDMLLDRYNAQCKLYKKRKYGDSRDNYLLFDGANRIVYLKLIAKAYASIGLESHGSHVLRHTLSTEWTELKISEKVSELVLGHKRQAHENYVHIVGEVIRKRRLGAALKTFKKSNRKNSRT